MGALSKIRLIIVWVLRPGMRRLLVRAGRLSVAPRVGIWLLILVVALWRSAGRWLLVVLLSALLLLSSVVVVVGGGRLARGAALLLFARFGDAVHTTINVKNHLVSQYDQ